MISFCEHEPNMPAVFDYFHETRTHRAGGRPGARERVESDRAKSRHDKTAHSALKAVPQGQKSLAHP